MKIRQTVDKAHTPRLSRRLTGRAIGPVLTVSAAIILVWYLAAVLLNTPFQRGQDALQERAPSTIIFIQSTLSQKRPVLPAPHQVAQSLWEGVADNRVTSKRSLLYHSWITLSSTLLGFAMGTGLGILLAAAIVHVKVAEKSLMPWIIISQTIPILALAPMLVLMLDAVGIRGLIPKALVSTYLSFFPVAIGMVKGLRSPDIIERDLMRTYSASSWQTFWKLRWPSAMPYLFTSMKVAIAIAMVGAIVGELPTSGGGGLGTRLLAGSYYGQIVMIWSTLFMAAFCAAMLVALVGFFDKRVRRRMGMAA